METKFDRRLFEAQISLDYITTDELPALAADALEAGYDGQHLVRMAILDPRSPWLIEQAVPGMLTDLGCALISRAKAALLLGCVRARRILHSGDDPLPHLGHFYKLYLDTWDSPESPDALHDLAYLEDSCHFATDSPQEQRFLALEALKRFVAAHCSI